MKKLLSALIVGAMLLAAVPSVLVNTVDAVSLTLKESSHLVLDVSTGYIDKIDGKITAAELQAEFDAPIWIKGPDGTTKEDDDLVASDDTVNLVAGTESMKVLIYGDVNRDGEINLIDVVFLLRAIAGQDVDICKAAGNVDTANPALTTADVVKLLRYVAKWDNISLGDVRMVFENTKLTAPNEDADIDMYFASTMLKIGRSNTTSTGNYAYKMTLASNENEACQVILSSTANKEGLSAEITPFEHEFGEATLTGTLNWEVYYDMALFNGLIPLHYDNNVQDYYPEAIPPMAESFELTANRSQGIMISLKTEKNTPAGMYKATFNIKDSDGKVIKTANVYAYVYNFNLPDTPYSASAFNIGRGDLVGKVSKYTDLSGDEIYKMYYDFLLDYRISAYNMPYYVSDERADAYMNDPRVTSFVISGTYNHYAGEMGRPNDEIIAAYAKVKANDLWYNKGYFYYADEPTGINGLAVVRESYEFLQNLLGFEKLSDIRNMTPLGGNKSFLDEEYNITDPVERIKDYINVWCPQSHAYTSVRYENGGWSSRNAVELFGEYSERAEKFRERGDTIWWYVCVDPQIPYPNFFNYYQGAWVRMVLWQQFMCDVDGLLYYSTTACWNNITERYYQVDSAGDGLLMYWGQLYGFEDPVASWRLVQIRDGLDDFDYLRMAEELLGREAVLKVVNDKVTSGMLKFSEDYRDIEAAKDVIARMIEDAM